MTKNYDTRCAVCYAEWNEADLQEAGIKGCPHCKTLVTPMKTFHDGYIQVNWQELRMLAIFAMRWMDLHDTSNPFNKHSKLALQNILKNLSRYQPKNGASIVPDIDPGRIPAEIISMIRSIKAPKEEKKLEFMFDINNDDLKPNEEGKIPSPFIKKKN